jgi:hypothetical protein
MFGTFMLSRIFAARRLADIDPVIQTSPAIGVIG